MLARKRKRCLRIVIKFAVRPGSRVMTGRAQRGHEAGLRMRRAVRCRVVLRVAAIAIDGCAFELAVDVAGGALQRGVCAG